MSDSSVITKTVHGSALFTSVFWNFWINFNMKNYGHHSVPDTSGMSPERCFYPHSWKGIFCKALRALNSNAFNCSWHYYCMTKYQHVKYCPVTLKFSQLGMYAIKSIGKQVPYFLLPQPGSFQAAHSQDFSVLWDVESQCDPLLGEFSQKSLTNLISPCFP